MILHCQKTGRHWPCRDMDAVSKTVRDYGLKDYWITVAGDVPPSMRETIAEALARPRHSITAGIE
ncbi:hypothetical protein [Pseudogemmobacter sonorensis]|uniref:hypothetical protein n=1 Tax=Pseudogemmobacter sonorensis TaxID=2989681 RepID=UPI00367618F9